MEWNNQVVYTIYWDSNDSEYLYGSQLNIRANRTINFRNELMTPGTILSKWLSHTNYQETRQTPALPYLKNGEVYQVKHVYKNLSSGTLFLKFIFYDFFGQVIKEQILRTATGTIEVPKMYKSYTVELITAGCFEFEFYYLELLYGQPEIEEAEDLQLTGLVSEYLSKVDSATQTLNVLLWEPGANLTKSDYQLINNKLENVLLIGQATINYYSYFDEQNLLKIQELYEVEGREVVFWGFNRWSNYIASYYKKIMPRSKINIGAQILLPADMLKLERILKGSNLEPLLDQVDTPLAVSAEPREMLKYSNYSSQFLKERLQELSEEK